MVKLLIDQKEIIAEEGANLLAVCLENDVYVPNLCYLKDQETPAASCRMCFVEIEGRRGPTTSCTETVAEGMVVRTDAPEVRRLQRSALTLLLSVHDVDCAHCPANKKCELQNLAKFLKVGLKPKKLDPYLKEPVIDQSHPCLDHYPNRCVLCGRCVRVCSDLHQKSSLTFTKRGFNTVIGAFGVSADAGAFCRDCLVCVEACPVGALVPKEPGEQTA